MTELVTTGSGSAMAAIMYYITDWTMVLVVISTMTDLLPPTAAILSIIWMTIRIFETRTVRGWIRKWKEPKCPDC